MSIRNLKALFRPQSVAVIGATTKVGTPGFVVMRNLLQAGFSGPVMPVSAEHKAISGVLAYPDIASLPLAPDLALVCTPASQIMGILRALGERGTKAACVMTPMVGASDDDTGSLHLKEMRVEARRHGMRLLGPGSTGMLVPGIGLNASLAPESVMPGKVAFLSQSGALCTAILDWAASKKIGFSHFIHTGDRADVGFGDILDYLGSDPHTRAILLYVEHIEERRNFMSAARAAARNKPLLVIKAGRSIHAQRPHEEFPEFHAASLASPDAVFDAAIRRAGMLRVQDIEEIFGAVETLARARPVKGPRLAILTNGGGIGVIAADDLLDGGGKLAELSPDVIDKLNAFLPPRASRGNPIDIGGYADGARYAKVLSVLLECKTIDAVLVMHAPTGISNPTEIAEAVVKALKDKPRANVMACFVGHEAVAPARKVFAENGVPAYETPRAAVQAFLHLLQYRRNQEMLMEVPPSAPSEFIPDTALARRLVQTALESGRTTLDEAESRELLEAYGIPTIETRVARTPAEASRIAHDYDQPVALKILSSDIAHKSDVGGVMLNLSGPFEVEKAAYAMMERVRGVYPDARIDGFLVQRMAIRRPGHQELIVGMSTDPLFGPAIVFGQGGVAVEVIADRALGLPPLNMALAAELVERTRVSRLLRGYSGRPPADMDAVYLTLIQLSQMVIDIPEIFQLDINPLVADSQGVLALDARVKLAPNTGADRLAIRPYPKELEEWFTMTDGRRTLLRPIRPEDEPNHHIFISKLTPEDIRFRFFGLVHELPHSEMARMTQIDFDREMAFIAEIDTDSGKETLGVVRTITDPDNEHAEFAIVVRSDLKGSGLGKRLLCKMIEYCRARQTGSIVGQVLKDNPRMLKFVEHLGFVPIRTIDGEIVEVELKLNGEPREHLPVPPDA